MSIAKHEEVLLVSLNSEIYAVQSCTQPNLVSLSAKVQSMLVII